MLSLFDMERIVTSDSVQRIFRITHTVYRVVIWNPWPQQWVGDFAFILWTCWNLLWVAAQRVHDAIITSSPRQNDVVFDVMKTSSLRHCCVVCPWGVLAKNYSDDGSVFSICVRSGLSIHCYTANVSALIVPTLNKIILSYAVRDRIIADPSHFNWQGTMDLLFKQESVASPGSPAA